MKPWKVILTDTALADLDAILETTLGSFGTVQLNRYATQIESAIRELEEAGDKAPLLKDRPDIQHGIACYPLARQGKASPHQFYLRFDTTSAEPAVIVLRVLHERMDPAKHL